MTRFSLKFNLAARTRCSSSIIARICAYLCSYAATRVQLNSLTCLLCVHVAACACAYAEQVNDDSVGEVKRVARLCGGKLG